MYYSEKIKLLLSGVKMDDIKALEEEEAKEAEAKAAEEAAKAAKAAEESKAEDSAKTAVELVKELEDKLTKLNSQIVALNNKRTVSESPHDKATATDVFKDLFAKKDKKEELNNGN